MNLLKFIILQIFLIFAPYLIMISGFVALPPGPINFFTYLIFLLSFLSCFLMIIYSIKLIRKNKKIYSYIISILFIIISIFLIILWLFSLIGIIKHQITPPENQEGIPSIYRKLY